MSTYHQQAPTTEAALQRNLCGLHFLESDQYAQAISEFSNALNMVKGVLSKNERNGELEDHNNESSFERVHKLVFRFHDGDGDPDEEMSDSYISYDMQDPVEDEEGPFIFQSPIIIGYAPTSCAQDKDDFYSLVKFSAAILFNLALSYHLAAMVVVNDDNKDQGDCQQHDIKQKKLLQKALTFYKLSYTMLQGTHNDGVMETMVIANNLGHVQRLVGDYDKAQQCYEHLLSTIMYVTDTGDRNSIQHFDGFFHSVQTMLLGTSHHRSAQAA